MTATPTKLDGTDAAICDARVDQLRSNIASDLHAADAARELLLEAIYYISCGYPVPEALRAVLCDGLEHLELHDPLAAFGHIRPPAKLGRGRRRRESDYEWIHVLRDVLRVRDEGFPLVVPGERFPFKELDGTAFAEYAQRHAEGNETAIRKEARRIQSGFWKHIRTLPSAQVESLGLTEYLPRKKS